MQLCAHTPWQDREERVACRKARESNVVTGDCSCSHSGALPSLLSTSKEPGSSDCPLLLVSEHDSTV